MKKPLVIAVTVSIASIGLILALAAYILTPGDSSEIEEFADSFQTDGKWELTNRRVEPAYRLCLGGNQCPSVRKDWRTDQEVNLSNFQSLIKDNRWNLSTQGSCEPRQNVYGEGSVCSASGRINNFDVQIYLSKNKDLPTSKLQLFVNPATE